MAQPSPIANILRGGTLIRFWCRSEAVRIVGYWSRAFTGRVPYTENVPSIRHDVTRWEPIADQAAARWSTTAVAMCRYSWPAPARTVTCDTARPCRSCTAAANRDAMPSVARVNIARSACRWAAKDNPPLSPRSAFSVNVLKHVDTFQRGHVLGALRPQHAIDAASGNTELLGDCGRTQLA
jgi:hypothetical protein